MFLTPGGCFFLFFSKRDGAFFRGPFGTFGMFGMFLYVGSSI